jgi:putative transposase
MPRKPRIEYPGACYHVMCRGNRKETIFRDDIDRNIFIATLGQTCDRTGWIVHSYVLMRNHYHLLLETPEANLSLGMQWFQGTYAQRYSIRHSLVGHVFQGRYKAPLIDPDDPEYFRIAGDYVHLNPARAGLLRGKSPRLSSYPWRSYPSFLSVPSKRPGWLEFSRVVNSLGIAKDDTRGRRRYRAYMESRALECRPGHREEEWERFRRGWYQGEDSFRDQLLDRIEETKHGKKESSFGGRIIAEHNEKRAHELIQKCRGIFGISAAELKEMKKTDPRKQGVVWLVKTQTVITNEWIDRECNMGSRTNIFQAVKVMECARKGKTAKIKKQLLNI